MPSSCSPSSSEPAAARGRPRSTASHQAVLSAVAHLIDVDQLGFEELTIEGIAAEAGVGKQTIYRWWSNKAAVVLEAIQAGYLSLDVGEVADTGDLAADLRTWMHQARERVFTESNIALVRSLVVAIVAAGGRAEEFLPVGGIPESSWLVRRLEVEAEQGRVREGVDAEMVAYLLLAPVVMKLIGAEVPSPSWMDALVDLVVAGVRR